MGFGKLFGSHGSSKRDEGGEAAGQFHDGLEVVHDNGIAAVDIIFIHGITGDPYKMWAADPSKDPWIKTLLPARVPEARILTFGYHSDVVGLSGRVSQNAIRNHAQNLVNYIAWDEQRTNDSTRPIIFICHSLGGLLLQKALLLASQDPHEKRKALVQCTYGISFMGTPLGGSDLQGLAESLRGVLNIVGSTNKKLLNILNQTSGELLDIQSAFRKLLSTPRPHGLEKVNVICFYESLTMPPFGLIVNEFSATLAGQYHGHAIHANHKKMVQFANASSPGYVALTSELNSWIGQLGKRVGVGGLSADGFYQQGYKLFEHFKRTNSASSQLEDAISLFTEAARLAGTVQPRDGLTCTRAHIGIAECRRELSHRHKFSYVQKGQHLAEAKKHLSRAWEEAVRLDSSSLQLRTKLELAVISARWVELDETQPETRQEDLIRARARAVEELSIAVETAGTMGREDLMMWGMKWMERLQGPMSRQRPDSVHPWADSIIG